MAKKLFLWMMVFGFAFISSGSSYSKFNFDKKDGGSYSLQSDGQKLKAINNGGQLNDFNGQIGSGAVMLSCPDNYLYTTGLGDAKTGTVQVYVYLFKKNKPGVCLISGYGSSLAPHLAIRLMKDKKGWYLRAESRYWDNKKNGWGLSTINNYNSRVPLFDKWIHVAYSWGEQGKQLWINGKKVAEKKNDKNPVHQLWKLGIGDITNKKRMQTIHSAQGIYDNLEIDSKQIENIQTQNIKKPVIKIKPALLKFNIDLSLRSDGMGATEMANRGVTGGIGRFSRRIISLDDSVELDSPDSFIWCGTGVGDSAAGSILLDFKPSPKIKPDSVIISARGKDNGYPLLVVAKKDSKGWYLQANFRMWKGKGWKTITIDNKDNRINISEKWVKLAVIWSNNGAELCIDGQKIASTTTTVLINQFWRLGIGDIPVSKGTGTRNSMLGSYSNLRFAAKKINLQHFIESEKKSKAPKKIKAVGAQKSTTDGSLQVTYNTQTGEILSIDSMFPEAQNVSQGVEAACYVGDKVYTVNVNDGKPQKNIPTACPINIETNYSIENDHIKVKVKFTAKRDIDKTTRLALRSRFNRTDWPYIIYYTSPKKRYPSFKTNILWFGEDSNDLSRSNDFLGWKGGVPTLPFITLERNDRYIVAGPLDLNSSCTMSSNEAGSYAPAIQRNPKKLKAGQSYELSLTFGNIPRRGYGYKDYADALGWYMNHCYSTNRLTRDLFCWNQPPRHPREEGNLWSYSGKLQKFSNSCTMNQWMASREKCIDESFTKHIWFFGWHSTDETYPTKGKYYVFRNYQHTSVEDTRKEIRRLQAKGLKIYMYFRQFAMLELVNDKKPPYKSWLAKDHKGEVITYDKGHSFKVPQRLQKIIGSDKLTWIHLNFDNDECRRWYINQAKQVLDYYKPDGIAWDMGWAGGSKLGHATMRIQADIYQWMKENHPEMQVIGNGDGNPSSFFEDMILLENTQVGSGNPEAKSPLDYVATTAFKVAVGGVDKQYIVGFVAKKLGCDRDKLHIELSLRTLGLGVTIGYPMNYPELKEAEKFSATLSNVPSQMFGIKILPFSQHIDASLWAGNGKCRGAVFNNSWKATEVEAKVPWKYLRMAGDGKLQLKWQLLGVNGPVSTVNKSDIDSCCIWKGKIPPKTLLTLTVENVK